MRYCFSDAQTEALLQRSFAQVTGLAYAGTPFGNGYIQFDLKRTGKNEWRTKIMKFPAELKYSRDHEWVKMLDDTTALIGISDFAQSELG